MNKFGNSFPLLVKKFWEELKLVYALIVDYVRGDYRDVSPRFLLTVVGVLAYLISPVDIVPDFIPVAGVLDDAVVLKFALDFVADDLRRYQLWKKTKA